jgi:pyrroline-5-carboxylate reductase
MADAGVKQGLPRDLAYKLAAQVSVVSANDTFLSSLNHILFFGIFD